MQLNEANERDGRSRKRVFVVAKGFDVSVPEGFTLRERVLRLESMLRDHFSSCGKVKSVCIPDVRRSFSIKRYAYIDIWGKGAEEKALKLSGREMDGHKLVVTLPLLHMKKTRRRALKTDRYRRSEIMIVRGYDTSLHPRKIMKSALRKHFSSYGEVLEVDLFPNKKSPNSNLKYAYVSIYGEGAKEKALQLSGSDMGGFKLVVEDPYLLKQPEAGGRSSSPDRVWAPSYSAKGFDATVPECCTVLKHVFHLESKLRNHFSSCGKVKSVCIPHAYYSSTIKSHAYIDIWGKGSEEKALQLSGSEMDGHKLVVTLPLRPMTRARRRALKQERSSRSESMIVWGYDTSLPRKIIKRALGKHFSSCGEVLEVDLRPNQAYPKDRNHAYVSIYGEGAKEKALQLGGRVMGGFELEVEKLGPIPRQPGDKPRDNVVVWSPPYSEFMARRNKRKEERNSNKRKENPNPHSNEQKKKRKTSK
ncbi:unnamed protein product [Microthlaspi erraticum]|uniref:RRM domain-containing protein n=1 Tax=Microthlaspi erraticum TaxID=1685480 RepID=A0A6D2JWU4_9BRAS|nr:unnamed protein product [Microthlaspi erraticum]